MECIKVIEMYSVMEDGSGLSLITPFFYLLLLFAIEYLRSKYPMKQIEKG